MIHFLPDPANAAAASAHDAGLARLDGLATALAAVGGGESATAVDRARTAWGMASGPDRAMIDANSVKAVAASAAGLEALAALRAMGLEPNPSATRLLAEEIRGQIERLGLTLSL